MARKKKRTNLKEAIFSVDELKASNKRCGMHFFDKDAMRFFKSRVGGRVYSSDKGACFVTSEQGPDNQRRYTARKWDGDSCKMDEIGEFQQYKTSKAAHAAARKACKR